MPPVSFLPSFSPGEQTLDETLDLLLPQAKSLRGLLRGILSFIPELDMKVTDQAAEGFRELGGKRTLKAPPASSSVLR